MTEPQPSEILVRLILEVQGEPQMPHIPDDASPELRSKVVEFMERMKARTKKTLRMLIEEHLSDDDIEYLTKMYRDPIYRKVAPKFQDICSRALAAVMEEIIVGVTEICDMAEEED